MTISSTDRVAGPYSGNDATVTFSFAFKVFAAADVQVILTDSTDTESVLTLTTDYTVTLNGNQDTNPGGSVTLLVAPATGEKLTVTSDQASYQSVNLANQGGFYPDVINNQLDKLVISIQQCERDIAQAARVPLSSSIDPDIVSDALITVATSIGDVETVAGSIGDVGTVATNIANVNLVGGDIANVNAVGNDIANVNSVAGDLSNVDIVAADIADVSTCADNIVLIQTAPAYAASAAASAIEAALSADESAAFADLALAANAAAEEAASASGDVLFYDTKADADAALSGLSENQIVEVMADEDVSGFRTRYRVEAGAYVFKIIVGEAKVATVDALRAIQYSAVLPTVQTLGCLASGDGGGGQWHWDAASVAADNVGTVVLPTGHVGAGRWIRTLADTDPIDVRWFGAVPYSATYSDYATEIAPIAGPNTTAINAALTFASARHYEGGGVVFGSGLFWVTGTITVPGGVTLGIPAGLAQYTITSPGNFAIRCAGTGYDAVVISGGYASLYSVMVFQAPQKAIVLNSGAGGVVIENCLTYHSYGDGIHLAGNNGSTLLTNTQVIGPGGHGMLIDSGDVRILGCEIQQPNNPIGGATANTKDCINVTAGPIQIMNCRMGDDAYQSRDAIRATNSSVMMTGCDLQNFTQSGLYLDGGSSHTITGNKFLTFSSAGANIAGIRIKSGTQVATSITGNVFNAPGSATGILGGIYIEAALNNVRIGSNMGYGNFTAPNYFIVYSSDTYRTGSTNCWIECAQYPMGHRFGLVLSGATPSVDAGSSAKVFWLENASPTTVTDFLNGYPGQEITLFSVDANTTIQHSNSYIRLANFQSWTMPSRSVLKLVKGTVQKGYGAIWYEVARFNGGSAGGISVGGQIFINSGTGSPESAVVGRPGCLFLRTDGGAGTTLYVKETGTDTNTGWVAK